MSSESISVREDPDLLQEEKQVSFVSTKADTEFRVHSEVRGLTNRLLAHPRFEEEDRRVLDGDMVAITGRLPIECVFVSEEPRVDDGWAQLVTDLVL